MQALHDEPNICRALNEVIACERYDKRGELALKTGLACVFVRASRQFPFISDRAASIFSVYAAISYSIALHTM